MIRNQGVLIKTKIQILKMMTKKKREHFFGKRKRLRLFQNISSVK